jgi:CubicO group peptidase (beta-lactamase class C family)
MASDSKQFTSAAVALLVLQGKVSLDDDTRKYFPEMRDYGTPIRVRNLLNHTSGVRDIFQLMSVGGYRVEDVLSRADAVALITRQENLNFKPGEKYSYSNGGYILLGELVQRVSGQSLREFTTQQIFQPLGMTHTSFHDQPRITMKNWAVSYEADGAGGYRVAFNQNFGQVGDGGLFSSVDDLAKWDENYYTHTVGGDALQRLIHTHGILNNGDTIPYMFGNASGADRGLRTVSHNGSFMGYKADITRYPDQHFSVITTCNLGSINPSLTTREIAALYLGDKMSPKPAAPAAGGAGQGGRGNQPAANIKLSAADLDALVGDYRSDALDVTYHVTRTAYGGLALSYRTFPLRSLVPTAPNAFRAPGVVLQFERQGSGRATGLGVGPAPGIPFVRQ